MSNCSWRAASMSSTARPRQRLLPFGDRRALWRHLGVQRDEIPPLLRHVILVKNRLDRAFRLTCAAVDTLVRVRPDVPETIEAIVNRCLAADSKERFPSMDDLIAALGKAHTAASSA